MKCLINECENINIHSKGLCKKCYMKKYYKNNKEKLNKSNKNWYENNKEKYMENRKENSKKWRENHKDKNKEYHIKWCENHKEELRKYRKEYNKNHKEERKIYRKEYNEINKEKRNINIKKRRNEDISFKILCSLRSRLCSALKGKYKSKSTIQLIGCSVIYLKQHLQSQFLNGMSLENYGEWDIDHIIPCCSFNLEKEEEQKKCFHYSNLRPMWHIDNIKKNYRIYFPEDIMVIENQ